MLQARARFLESDRFAPIADALLTALPRREGLSVIDAGAGTGYYLRRVLSESPGGSEALAMDASSAAVSMSVASTGACGLVADIWSPIPVLDDRADVILCVFSPRNAAEFHRILRPGGRLLVVTPTERHLAELRAARLLIGIQERKRERLDEALSTHFELDRRSPVEFQFDLDSEAAFDLTTMGPSGHHELAGAWPGGTVTASIELSEFSARSDRGSTRTASR